MTLLLNKDLPTERLKFVLSKLNALLEAPNGFGLYSEPEKFTYKPGIFNLFDKILFSTPLICPDRKSEILVTKISTPEFKPSDEFTVLGAKLLNDKKCNLFIQFVFIF